MKQQPATATATSTEASALSAGGAAGLDAPSGRGALRRDVPGARPENGNGSHNPRTGRSGKRREKRLQNVARRAAREAEASARRSRMEELTKTLGPEAAKQALRREVKEEREAQRLARQEAIQADKKEKRAQRMIRDAARGKRRGREFSLPPSSSASSLALRDIFPSKAIFHHLVAQPSSPLSPTFP